MEIVISKYGTEMHFSKPRQRRKRERHQTIGLISRTWILNLCTILPVICKIPVGEREPQWLIFRILFLELNPVIANLA